MEVCFVDSTIGEFVAREAAERAELHGAVPDSPARVVDREGHELGRAEPYYRYTVGQRRGLGVSGGRRLYVLEVLPGENAVVVGDESELMASGLAG